MPSTFTPPSPAGADPDPAVSEALDALGELAVAQRRLRGRDALRTEGLTYPQLRLLAALDEDEGCPAGHLAEQAGVTPGTVTGMLDILEGMGVITRVRSERDRRVVLVHLTDEGRRARDVQRAEARRVFEEALSVLDPADLAAAPRVLRVLARAMEAL